MSDRYGELSHMDHIMLSRIEDRLAELRDELESNTKAINRLVVAIGTAVSRQLVTGSEEMLMVKGVIAEASGPSCDDE